MSFLLAPQAPKTPAEPALAPNSFQLQRYGANPTLPMRTQPAGFNNHSLASQLPADYGKPVAAAPAPAPAAAPVDAGPFAEFFRLMQEQFQPKQNYLNDGH